MDKGTDKDRRSDDRRQKSGAGFSGEERRQGDRRTARAPADYSILNS